MCTLRSRTGPSPAVFGVSLFVRTCDTHLFIGQVSWNILCRDADPVSHLDLCQVAAEFHLHTGALTSCLVRDMYNSSLAVTESWLQLVRVCVFSVSRCPPVFQVGDRDDSNLYISTKLKAAAEVRIQTETTSQVVLNDLLPQVTNQQRTCCETVRRPNTDEKQTAGNRYQTNCCFSSGS